MRRQLRPSCKLVSTVCALRGPRNRSWSREHHGLVHGVRVCYLFPVFGTYLLIAWTTSGNSDAFTTAAIQDPLNNTAIEMHQYLDSDGSGTNQVCVSSTIGAERLAAATTWLKSSGFKGFLGEIGAGSDSDCIEAVYGALCSMQQAGGVWLGAAWWAAGPWWGDVRILFIT